MICAAVLVSLVLVGEPVEAEDGADFEAVERAEAVDELESSPGDEAPTKTEASEEVDASGDAVGEERDAPAEVLCECEEQEAPLEDAPKPPVRKLLVGGGVFAAAGIGGVVAGAALLGARRDDVGPDGGEPNVTDYRRSGAIALGVGAAALVTGVALLVADRRKQKGKATALVVPGPGAGLGVYARF
jgi:hypothetical protein